MRKPKKFLWALLLPIVLTLSSCTSLLPTATPTPTYAPTQIEPTSTPEPLGSLSNPIKIGYVHSIQDPSYEDAAKNISQYLTETTGISVSHQIFTSYQALIEELSSGKIQAAWLPPLTYIYAHQKNIANVKLITNHFGTYFYGSQILANIESGFVVYFDQASNQSTTDALTAMQQLDGKRACYVEPTSASGYIYPAGILQENNLQTQESVFVQSHTAVVRALYIKGICDFGVTFTTSGDPRTSSAVSDLPDVAKRVITIWQTPADIPNLNFSVHPSISEEMVEQLSTALMDDAANPEGKILITQANGNYDIQDLKVIDDSVYDPLRNALEALGIDPVLLIGK